VTQCCGYAFMKKPSFYPDRGLRQDIAVTY